MLQRDPLQTCPFLKEIERADVLDFAQEFWSLFTEAAGTTSLVQHYTNLTSNEPVQSKPYSVPYSMRGALKKGIDDMMKMEVIRESNCFYASPVVVVWKKDGSNRLCLDYRKLNKLSVFYPEPMPAAVELFQKLNGKKSKGDWCRYPKDGLCHPRRLVRVSKKVPSGMVNSAATLKRGMKKLLKRY